MERAPSWVWRRVAPGVHLQRQSFISHSPVTRQSPSSHSTAAHHALIRHSWVIHWVTTRPPAHPPNVLDARHFMSSVVTFCASVAYTSRQSHARRHATALAPPLHRQGAAQVLIMSTTCPACTSMVLQAPCSHRYGDAGRGGASPLHSLV